MAARGSALTVRIVGTDLPGLRCGPAEGFAARDRVHVAVQRKDRPAELLDPQPADADRVCWTLPCTLTQGPDGPRVSGPYVQNRIGGRFVYLSWVSLAADGRAEMFRRGKLMLEAVPAPVLADAAQLGQLTAQLGLTDAHGLPVAARLIPPRVRWSAQRAT